LDDREAVAVALLIILSFAGTTAYRSTLPVASFYARSILGVSALAVGGMTAAFYLLRAGAAVGSGYASTSTRRAGALAAGAFALHVALVAYLASGPGYTGLLLLRGLQGVLNGLAWTSVQILLAAYVPPRFRGRAYAVYGISGSLGSLVGDLLYSRLGTHCLVYSTALFAASSLMSAWLALQASPERLVVAGEGPRGIARKRPGGAGLGGLALFTLVAAVAYVSVMGIGDIAYVYYKEVLGISKAATATLRGVAGFLGTLAGFGLGWLADIGGAGLAVALAYSAAAAGALLITVPSLYVAGLGIALVTAAGRAFFPTARKLASEMPRGNVMLGYLGAVTNIASATGALAYGYAYTSMGLREASVDGLSLVLAPLLAGLWAVVVPPLLLAVSRIRS
jgi:hypothetical protein